MVWHRRRIPLKRQLAIKERRYRHRWWRRIGWLILLVGVFGGGGVATYWYVTTPKLSSVFVNADHARLFAKQVNVRYLNSEGHVFYQSNAQTYQPATVKDIKQSPNLVHALVATEDRDYFKEGGVNWPHTFKAAVDTFTGHGVSGGSTITQQLIKLTFFSTARSDQTIKRKFQEIVLASQLAKKYSKDQILTWYFNKANYGNGQIGIKAASQYYYQRRPQDLSPLEAATLVGIVNSPASYNPYLTQGAMQHRRNVVLLSMQEAGYLSKAKTKRLQKEPLTTNLVKAKDNLTDKLNRRQQQLGYNGFVSAVDAQLGRYSNHLLDSTVTVKTSMNQGLQDQLNQLVQTTKYPDDQMQEAVVVLNNQTGQVAALSGGRNQTVLGGYNRAFNVKRSSGSAIKPLLDYGPGMDLYHWTANTPVEDTKYVYPGTNQVVNDWDHRLMGRISLATALQQSRNVPAVKALGSVGLDNGKKVLNALGLPSQNLFFANAIGVDTSPLALASAYSALANGGQRANARVVDSIDNGVNTIKMATVHEQVYSPQTAYLLTKILEGVISPRGTAGMSKIDGVTAAGKTGTVGRDDKDDALTDSWMVGYTQSYTVCVWVGYDNPYDQQHYLTNQTANVAQDLYKQTMRATSKLPGANNKDWTVPSGIRGQSFMNGVNTTGNDFLQAANRQWSYLPFELNRLPSQFWVFNHPKPVDQAKLNQLYQRVNQTA